MKSSKNEKRYIPKPLTELLANSDYKRKDDLYCILDLIYSKQSNYKNDLQKYHGWTEIPQIAFNSLIPNDKNLQSAINYLIGQGYLLRNDSYIFGNYGSKVKTYKVPQEYLGKKTAVEITDKRINERIKKRKMNMRKNRIDLKDAQSRYFKTFRIDAIAALQAAKEKALGEMILLIEKINFKASREQLESVIDCSGNYLLTRNLILQVKGGEELNHVLHRLMVHQRQIHSINDGFLYYKRNKTNGRLDTNLTSLPTYLRQFIKSEETLYNIDLKNSQPFFFYLKIRNEKLVDQSERELYGELVVSGRLYEFLAEKWKELVGSEKSREEMKKMLFKIFYSKTGSYKLYKDFFWNLFPTTMEYINYVNCDKHNTLAIAMQSIESFMILNVIMPNLGEMGIIPLTIHDSFVVNESEKDTVVEIIREKFFEINGVVPSLHIDRLGDFQDDCEDELFEIENDNIDETFFVT